MGNSENEEQGSAHVENDDDLRISSAFIACTTPLSLHRIPTDPDKFHHDLRHFDTVFATDLLRLAQCESSVRGSEQ